MKDGFVMVNLIFAWFGIVSLVVGPFLLGVVFEQKLQSANRELGPRILRRY